MKHPNALVEARKLELQRELQAIEEEERAAEQRAAQRRVLTFDTEQARRPRGRERKYCGFAKVIRGLQTGRMFRRHMWATEQGMPYVMLLTAPALRRVVSGPIPRGKSMCLVLEQEGKIVGNSYVWLPEKEDIFTQDWLDMGELEVWWKQHFPKGESDG